MSLNFLLKLKDKHSKMSKLSYDNLNLQTYFKTPIISTKEAKSLFKFRTRMANVKENFKTMYSQDDINCPECLNVSDSQEHLLDHTGISINKEKYDALFIDGDHEYKLYLVRHMDQVLSRRE